MSPLRYLFNREPSCGNFDTLVLIFQLDGSDDGSAPLASLESAYSEYPSMISANVEVETKPEEKDASGDDEDTENDRANEEVVGKGSPKE